MFSRDIATPGRGVLFVDTQGIGDVVQSLPLLQAVCRWTGERGPLYALFATPEHFEVIRKENLPIFPIFVRSGPNDRRCWFRVWRQIAGKMDWIISAPEISAAKVAFLKYAIGARWAVAESPRRFAPFLAFASQQSWTRPWNVTSDEIASALGIAVPLPTPEIHVDSHELKWADVALQSAGISEGAILGVQCSSAVPQKNWAPEKLVRLFREIARCFPSICVVSLGCDKEAAVSQHVRAKVDSMPWLQGAGLWSIRQSMAILSRCSLFISGDTGLMHLAAALKVRTVSIFGPTSASRRAPRGNNGVAICPNTSCHPCFRGRWTRCDCIQSIAVERVFAAAAQFISEEIQSKSISSSLPAESLAAVPR